MIRYGQYCPIAKALELLAERWTLLLVRELLMGSRRFNDLRRGVPLMGPSIMSQRLKALADGGIIVREHDPTRHCYEYRLTDAGEELRPLLMQLGTWGQRWSRSKMNTDDLDASFLMWDVRRNLQVDKLPRERVIIHFEFSDAKKGMRQWWLIVDEGQVDLCLEDPGHEVDVSVSTGLRTMTQVWMGDISLAQARGKGLLSVSGPARLIRSVGSWLGASPFADVAPARSHVAATT
ncbi:MAG: HxlR family transcriptional regulator [Betaproteobacteria bacterium]|jgi:DNA-binding HxlR family transcriptional regulator|nr:HxlR family transcriptional regulator [Betaproteobacteria bacterium]